MRTVNRFMAATFSLALGSVGVTGATSAYQVVDVAEGGTIRGTVAFAGEPPKPTRFEVEKNAEFCGQTRDVVKVDVHNGTLKGAVIVLEGLKQGKRFESWTFQGEPPGKGQFSYAGDASSSVQVHLKHCNFGPFVGVMPLDQPVRFVNEDPIKHTIHTYVALGSAAAVLRSVHNQHIGSGDTVELELDTDAIRRSRIVRLSCDRHDFMQSWLYMVDSPYFAISDQNGQFVIDRVPPGRYTLRAWHPILGQIEEDVTIGQEQTLQLDFTFGRS